MYRPGSAPLGSGRRPLGSTGGGGPDLAERGRTDRGRRPVDPAALGSRGGDPGQGRPLDHRRRRAGARGRPNARARPLAQRASPRGSRGSSGVRLRRGSASREGARPDPQGGRRAGRPRGSADRADDGAARNADRDRGHAQRAGPDCDGADRRRASRRLPPGRAAAADQGVRAIDPQDRRGRGAPLPPLRPRAADPPGCRRAPDGRGDGGPGARPPPAHLAADGVHPPALPALLHRAGRGRAHGGGAWRAAAAGPGPDGVLLRRPDRVHSLHGGGGRRGGLRPRGAFRGDRRGHPARRGDDREDDRRRGDDRLARSGDAHGVGGRLPDAVPGTTPAARRRALRACGLSRRRLLRHRGQPDPPCGRPRPRRRGDDHHRGRRWDRQLGLPRVRPDRRGRAEGLSPASGAVRRQAPRRPTPTPDRIAAD